MHFTHMYVNTHTTICYIHNKTDYSIHSIVTIVTIHILFCIFVFYDFYGNVLYICSDIFTLSFKVHSYVRPSRGKLINVNHFHESQLSAINLI